MTGEKAALTSSAAFFVVSGQPENSKNSNNMVKTNQSIGRESYVRPSCKMSELHLRHSVMTASNYGEPGEAGGSGNYVIDEEDY